jgi:hypothetical protein
VIRLKFTGHLAPTGPDGPQPPIDEFIERLLKDQKTDAGAQRPS